MPAACSSNQARPARIHTTFRTLASNHPPALTDQSGADAARLAGLTMQKNLVASNVAKEMCPASLLDRDPVQYHTKTSKHNALLMLQSAGPETMSAHIPGRIG